MQPFRFVFVGLHVKEWFCCCWLSIVWNTELDKTCACTDAELGQTYPAVLRAIRWVEAKMRTRQAIRVLTGNSLANPANRLLSLELFCIPNQIRLIFVFPQLLQNGHRWTEEHRAKANDCFGNLGGYFTHLCRGSWCTMSSFMSVATWTLCMCTCTK